MKIKNNTTSKVKLSTIAAILAVCVLSFFVLYTYHSSKMINIKNPSDKAISAGENSTITGENIHVSGGEIGVVSKDLSKINLTNLSIIDTRLGISAFQKKSEYGVASIQISKLTLKNNELDYLIENRSSLIIDNVAVKTVSNNVIDQMYGKEYGKSSR